MKDIFSLWRMLFNVERRRSNPARITAHTIQREHEADVAIIQRQAEELIDQKHGRK